MFFAFIFRRGKFARQRKRALFHRRLRMESLERRNLLATFLVTTTLDVIPSPNDSVVSLREAILFANASSDADIINFDPVVFAGSKEMVLTNGELYITETLTINGTGQSHLSIDGGGLSRVLRFSGLSGDLTLNGLTITGGKSTANNDHGGGVRFESSGMLSLNSSTLSGNSTTGTAANGGGISVRDGNVTLTNSTLSGNSTTGASANGGGIFALNGSVTLTNSTLSGNSTTGISSDGGGISVDTFENGGILGAVTLTNSTLSGNSTKGNSSDGGGISVDSFEAGGSIGAVTLTNSTLSGNSTVGQGARGGGIFTHLGFVTLTNSTLSGNSTVGQGARGGGVYGTVIDMKLTNSTVSGNTTTGFRARGGGIYGGNGRVTLTNSTVSGNSTTGENAGGGGINAAELTLVNSIVALNTVASGFSRNPDLQSSEISPNPIDARFSLIGDNSGTLLIGAPVGSPDVNGNLIGIDAAKIDPLLGPLQNNGGPTSTHALLAGSPALNRGSSPLLAGVTTDQRNAPFVRSFGTAPDMGAYEFQTLVPSLFVVTTTVDELNYGNTTVSLREAINSANGNVGADTITFATNVFATPQTIGLTLGQLLISETLTINGQGNVTIDAKGNSRVMQFSDFSGDLSLSDLTITGGKTTADFDGGGGILFFSIGTLSISGSTLSGNSTAGDFAQGGGISAGSGNMILTNSTLSGNSTTGTRASGGGIFASSGAVTLTGSTVSGNSTVGYGGGIFAGNAAVTLTSSTLSGNSAAGYGGGIYASSGAVTLTSTTLSSNRTTGSFARGGGIVARNGKLTLANSILALNTVASDVTNPDLSLNGIGTNAPDIRSSLIGDNSGTLLTGAPMGFPDVNGNLIGTGAAKIDPLLGPLQNNGGPTFTRALRVGSPAIDKGKRFGISTIDQRGWTRTIDLPGIANSTIAGSDGTDIGAVEMVGVSIASASVLENAGSLAFTITLSSAIPVGQTVKVLFSTANIVGQALAGTDYTAVTNRIITFTGGGPLTQQTTVLLTNDSLVEPNETFSVTLSQPTGAILSTPTAVGTIVNDAFIVDNSDAGYSEAGLWGSSSVTGFNGSSTRFANAANVAATWNAPSLAPGYYSVAIYRLAVSTNSQAANFTVVHNGITEAPISVNLAPTTSGFFEVGTFFFSGAPGELVRLSQGATVGNLRTDAVRFNRLPIANAAPTITAPTTQSVAGNTPRVFSTANTNAITVADVDTGLATVQLTLTATSGLLTLPSTTGLTFTSGVNGQASFTVRGTLASLNSAVNGLSYLPNLNFSGSASINLVLNDLGNTGLGGAQSTTRTIALTVLSPAFIVDNTDAGYSEVGLWGSSSVTGFNGSSTRLANAANVAATWSAPSLAPGYYSVAIYRLAVSTNSQAANFTVVHNGITEAPISVNLAPSTSGFFEVGTFFFSGAPGELVRLSQGATVGNLRTDAVRFNRLPIANAAPTITAPTTQSVAGNTPRVFSTANTNAIKVADVDTGLATVQLTLTATSGLLTLPSTTGLTFTSGVNGQASFTVRGTLASLNLAVNGLSYLPNLNFSGSASINLVLNDLGNTGLGGAQSTTRTIALTVLSPAFIVDNTDAGYSEVGLWGSSSVTGFNGSSTRLANAANVAATWSAPSLAPGYYSVAIYRLAVSTNSQAANFTVVHNGITEAPISVNLAPSTSGFFEVGTFFFSGAPGELVRLSQGATVGNLRTDAVRFTKLP